MAYLKGIDVSHHQGAINWSKVDDDIKFAFIKATEGTSFVDPKFHANYSGAKVSGRMVGAYHFARFSSVNEAQAEALHFLSVVGDCDLDFHILDLEVGSGNLTDATKAFFQVLRDHKRGGLFLYTNPSFMSNHLKKDVVANDVQLWIAHYGVDKPTVLYWSDWMFWQYTSSGTVSGISGRVDMNYAKQEVISGKIEQMSLKKQKPKPKPKNDGLLRRGDKGAAVKELQEKLLKAGEKLPRYGADGDFGAETEEAVKAFQARHGLVADGIWGPKSEAMMEKVLCKKAKSKTALPSDVLRKGDHGEKVKQLQKALNQLHFNCGAVDGIYGNKTEDAVRRFQMVYLPYEVDGIYGPHTKNAMQKLL